MSNDIDLKKITDSLRKTAKKVRGYSGFLFLVGVLLIYSFLVFRISVLSDPKLSDSALEEKAKTTKRLKVDQDAINKIQQLEDQNVGVQSLFEEARDNPFQD